MWYTTENSDNIKPSQLDTTSSERWNYVRKDFTLIPETEETPEHWKYMENKILKSDWELYMQVADHGIALDDVYAALTELADLIA